VVGALGRWLIAPIGFDRGRMRDWWVMRCRLWRQRILRRFGLDEYDALPPDDRWLIIVIHDADTMGILPADFAVDQVAGGDFDFDFAAVFDQVLKLSDAR
jgi:hypothetical protein